LARKQILQICDISRKCTLLQATQIDKHTQKMHTRESPQKSAKARDRLSQKSFRWCDDSRKALLTLLINEPKLYTVKNISNREKYTRILNRLDKEVFKRCDVKWESIQNGMDWLVKSYRVQAERFRKTGEGPSKKERDKGAQNLDRMNLH
jgi:hypothetical protein